MKRQPVGLTVIDSSIASTSGLVYADVAVDTPTSGRDDLFTYSIPANLDVKVGQLVRAPFGSRIVHGVVIRLTDSIRVGYSKPLFSLVRPEPLLNLAQLRLADWVSDYYRTSLFEAISPMLPPGFRGRTKRSVRLLVDGHDLGTKLTLPQARLIEYLRERRQAVSLSFLVRNLGTGVVNVVRELAEAGFVEDHWGWKEPKVGPKAKEFLMLCGGIQQVKQQIELLRIERKNRQANLLQLMVAAEGNECFATLARQGYGSDTVSILINRGFVRLDFRHDSPPILPKPILEGCELPLIPTQQQAVALSQVAAVLEDEEKKPRVMLLHGVTGSGKTEVYLQSLAMCISKGKRGIVLVPEHALVPQAIERFNARFPGKVAVLHSGLTLRQQFDQWQGIRRGNFAIVIGSRSAIFAPQRDLGLIILDEEHERTYKQEDTSPRYHAKEVAVKLAELTGAAVLLGSATPDMGSFHNALQGRYVLLKLDSRIEATGRPTPLAVVEIVDMRQELRDGNRSVFSRILQDKLQDCVAAGHQAILFLNRRGTSNIVQCRNCGFTLRCWRCSNTYTFHGVEGLICHQCNRRRKVPTTCPQCRGPNIRYLGLGTQRLVEEVREVLPNARIIRWDRDTARNPRAHEELLTTFKRGEADVLVGTQMIAKGLHIPAVTLVGVVLADIGLNVPDYRSSERTFQVLCQVAGRAGRGGAMGSVVVQSYMPDHYAIQAAATQDYESFYHQEILFRKTYSDPPMGRLIRLIFNHQGADASRREAQRLANSLRRLAGQWGISRVQVIGPAPTYPPRNRNGWGWQILLRGDNPRELLGKVVLPQNWVVDIDPGAVS